MGHRPSPTLDLPPVQHGLTEIIRAFKSFSSRRINQLRGAQSIPVWQRNFHDHIIRDERGLNTLRQYIVENPARWAADTYHES